jgi:ABC-type sugar transport system ATPase subunit
MGLWIPERTVSGLEFRGVTKSFGAVRALRNVSFAVDSGSAHALVGENGAGKSTLMKILAGITRPDDGQVLWDGERLSLRHPRHALDRGIGMVYQEMVLFPNLTVSENIFAGRERIGPGGWLRKRPMRDRTAELLAELHLPLDPETEVATLGSAHRQLLQIARALAFDCRVLILDEPTTCLTDGETADLFHTLERLRSRGVTLIYVSHKLPEIFRLCDHVTILRDGEHVATAPRRDLTPEAVVRSMVGRDLEPPAATTAAEAIARAAGHAPLLSVTGLSRQPYFEDLSLSVRPGEIVGLFGLIGSGRSELAETIFGLYAPERGEMTLDGAPFHPRSPIEAVRGGIALAPEDRQQQGLFMNLGVGDNLSVARELAAHHRRIDARAEVEAGEALVKAWRIKTPSLTASPDSLSGGNQQKVLLARWLSTNPRLLILDEPTKGVDVGAKYEIHDMIRAHAARGMGCLLISSELPEVLALAHRVVVLREGRLQGELTAAQASEEAVMRLATAVLH